VEKILTISLGPDLEVYTLLRPSLEAAIAHDGPCGSLEKYFIKGSNKKIKRTSFDALGLYIAKKIVNELEYRRFGGGKNEFVIVMNLP